MLQPEVCLRSSLSPIHDAVKAAPFNHDVHHRGFWPKQLMAVWSLLLHGDSEGPPLISPTAWRSRVFLTQSNPDFLLGGRTSASAECRHWSGRAVRWSSCAILLSCAYACRRWRYRLVAQAAQAQCDYRLAQFRCPPTSSTRCCAGRSRMTSRLACARSDSP